MIHLENVRYTRYSQLARLCSRKERLTIVDHPSADIHTTLPVEFGPLLLRPRARTLDFNFDMPWALLCQAAQSLVFVSLPSTVDLVFTAGWPDRDGPFAKQVTLIKDIVLSFERACSLWVPSSQLHVERHSPYLRIGSDRITWQCLKAAPVIRYHKADATGSAWV